MILNDEKMTLLYTTPPTILPCFTRLLLKLFQIVLNMFSLSNLQNKGTYFNISE